MKVIDVPENNLTLGPPQGWDAEKHGECEVITAHRDEDGFTVTAELDEGELERLQQGKPLKLRIFGASFPPVSIWVAE